ncbi:MAG: hypothetical protein EA426_08220 [Spirochaetaceae bacterium]|nr:MAG: hypothetical protein EA426_08220 [Spirochaetaceae bacterium]
MEKTMIRKKSPRPSAASATITTIAVLALFLAGCDRGTVGIFASIEREEKTIQSNLPKDQTVTGFTEADGAYFVAIGPRIWRRSTTDVGDEPWDTIPVPTGAGEYVAAGVASSGSIVVAAFVGEAGSVIAVRDAADESNEWEWATANLVGQVDTLLSAGDAVFVVENRTGVGHFFHHVNLTDADDPTTDELALPGQQPRVLDATFDGTTYRFVTSNAVLSSAEPNVAPTVVATAPGGITNIGGIAVTEDGTLVVSSDVVSSDSAGKVAYSTDGGTSWTESGVAADVRFPSVAVIGDTVYLGARRGVYTLPVTGLEGTPAVATGQAYESAALRNASVLGGFFEASDEDIFILTNKGLWRRNVDDDSVSWIWE